jgi:ornithine carbamoyltransferase
MSPTPKHFLDLDALDAPTLRAIVDSAAAMKKSGRVPKALGVPAGAVLAMIFEKPSTRTRVSFEVAIHQLGGTSIVLSPQDMQLGRGETVADTARVLSRYVDSILLRTGPHATLLDFAEHATIPVINGLTARSHPCQIMADVLTFEERKGPIKGRAVAWIGDANNVATSWVHAAARFGFALRIAAPADFAPAPELLAWANSEGATIDVMDSAQAAAQGADCVVTDVWVSMGDNDEDKRKATLRPFQVNEAIMGTAKADAIFMHCLPAHRGNEVTTAVMDGPQSAVWDEAENRLHAQKAILAWCLGNGRLGSSRRGAKARGTKKVRPAVKRKAAKRAPAKRTAGARKTPRGTKAASRAKSRKPRGARR